MPALARTAASAITIGSGGSAGSEGPVAVLGAAAGSLLGRIFRFEGNRVKVLVGAGAAAGISAAFNAPLAGAFFALEEILGSFTASAFPAVVVSSVIAAVVSRAFFGNHPAFPIPAEYGYTLLRELLLFYPILGVLAGLASALFVWTYFRTDEWVRRLPLSPYVDAVDWEACWWARWCISPAEFWWATATWRCISRCSAGWPGGRWPLLALGKIVATSLTLNTGGSGGVFTPSLYIGAATGGSFGVAISAPLPRPAPAPGGVRAGGNGRGGGGRNRRADHRDPDRVRDDQRLRHRAAADAGDGDLPLRGPSAGARFLI